MLLSELTTISEFRHPGLASTVALVGNRHGGSEAYMESLREQLAVYEARGAAIHYEDMHYANDEELSSESPSIQKIYHTLEFMKGAVDEGVKTDDEANIGDVILPKTGNWEVHDATSLQLAKYIHKGPIRQLALVTFSKMMRLQTKVPETRREKLEDGLYYATALLAINGLYSSLITYRNNIALKAVDDTLSKTPDQDITLLWGQGHVPGLTKGLYRRGFRRTHIAAYSPDEQPVTSTV